jgi:hypothetical protein
MAMTIWHPFRPTPGHRPGDATQDAPSDLPSWVTGPWTPQSLAETQLDMWRHAAAATHAWWQYMTIAWPAWPVNEAPPQATPAPTPHETPHVTLRGAGEDAPPPRHARTATTAAPRQSARKSTAAKRPKR